MSGGDFDRVISRLQGAVLRSPERRVVLNVHRECARIAKTHPWFSWWPFWTLDEVCEVVTPAREFVKKNPWGQVIYRMKHPRVVTPLKFPEIDKVFDPFTPGYMPTAEERYERGFMFLRLLGQFGIAQSCAVAVGVDYPTLLVWINADERLKQLAGISELAVQRLLEDYMILLAQSGDGDMLRFLASKKNPDYMDEKRQQTDSGSRLTDAQKQVFAVIQEAANLIVENDRKRTEHHYPPRETGAELVIASIKVGD